MISRLFVTRNVIKSSRFYYNKISLRTQQQIRKLSENVKQQSETITESKVEPPQTPPPPPPQGGGSGMGYLIVLLGLGGAGYYFQDEIKEKLGMNDKKDDIVIEEEIVKKVDETTSENTLKDKLDEAKSKIIEDVQKSEEMIKETAEKIESEVKEVVKSLEPVDWNEVKKAIVDLLDDDNYDDGSYGPIFVRLAWHSAGTFNKEKNTGGSEGAGMRFANEASWGANNGLDIARQRLEKVKLQFPSISYSDLWSFAGTVALIEMGCEALEGKWRPGREDNGSDAEPLPDGLLPDADGREYQNEPAKHLREIFNRMGFNDKEIVCLSGAHALGRCHEKVSGFWGPWTRAPTTFSNEYYRLLIEEKWSIKKSHQGRQWNGNLQYEDPTGDLMMLPTDMSLVFDKNLKPYVEEYAKNDKLFEQDFAKVWIKLQENGVKKFQSSWWKFW